MGLVMLAMLFDIIITFGILVVRKKAEVFLPRTGVLACCCILCSLGSLALVVSPALGRDTWWLIIAGEIISGSASAVLYIQIGLLFCTGGDKDDAPLREIFACLFATLLLWCSTALIPAIAVQVLATILPLACGCFVRWSITDEASKEEYVSIRSADYKRLQPLIVRFLIFLYTFVFYASTLKYLYRDASADPQQTVPSLFLVVLITAVAGLLLLSPSLKKGRRLDIARLYNLIFFSVVISVALFSFRGLDPVVSFGVSLFMVQLVNMVIFMFSVQLFAKTRISPVSILCITEITLMIGHCSPTGLLLFSPRVAIAIADNIAAVASLSMVVLAFVFIFVFTKRNVAFLLETNHKPTIQDIVEIRTLELASQFTLTNRELDVLKLLAQGRTADRIAHELFLSRGTVNSYLSRIYKKLDIHTRQELLDLYDAKPESGMDEDLMKSE